jgi:integration host factor subunit beta
MNKSDLISSLAERREIPLKVSETIVNTIFDSMSDTMIGNGRIEIRGFGSFAIREYDGYSARNPKSGLPVEVKSKRSPFFKAGKDMKELVNGK